MMYLRIYLAKLHLVTVFAAAPPRAIELGAFGGAADEAREFPIDAFSVTLGDINFGYGQYL
jgi:hypothetical protein